MVLSDEYLFFKYRGRPDDYINEVLGIYEDTIMTYGGVYPLYDELIYDDQKDIYIDLEEGITYKKEELYFCAKCGDLNFVKNGCSSCGKTD